MTIEHYRDNIEFIKKFMTVNPKDGTISYRLVTLADFDNNEEQLRYFEETHSSGRKLFVNGKDSQGHRVEYINGSLLRADIVAFILYHDRLPDSAIYHRNGRNSIDTIENICEVSTSDADYKLKRGNLVQLIVDRFSYSADTGKFSYIPLGLAYFKSVAEMNRYNARFNNVSAFTTTDGNGYLEETIFGHRVKAHIAAYILMNQSLPAKQLTFADFDRSNTKWSNITYRDAAKIH